MYLDRRIGVDLFGGREEGWQMSLPCELIL